MISIEVCAKCRKQAYGPSQATIDFINYCCPVMNKMISETWPNPPRACDHKLEHAVYATVNIDKKK